MGALERSDLLKKLIHCNYKTAQKIVPLCGTEDTPSITQIVTMVLDKVEDLSLRPISDYGLEDFRNDPDKQMFLTASSQQDLSPELRHKCQTKYITKANRGMIMLVLQVLSLALITSSSLVPGTRVHKSVGDQHIIRIVDGEEKSINLKCAFHMNIDVLIHAVMKTSSEAANMRDFGAPNFEAFTVKMENDERTRERWFPNMPAFFQKHGHFIHNVKKFGVKTTYESNYEQPDRVWPHKLFLLQNISQAATYYNREHLDKLMVDGEIKKGKVFQWTKVFKLIPRNQHPTFSSCIKWQKLENVTIHLPDLVLHSSGEDDEEDD